jgi:hypothetical protein
MVDLNADSPSLVQNLLSYLSDSVSLAIFNNRSGVQARFGGFLSTFDQQYTVPATYAAFLIARLGCLWKRRQQSDLTV